MGLNILGNAGHSDKDVEVKISKGEQEAAISEIHIYLYICELAGCGSPMGG